MQNIVLHFYYFSPDAIDWMSHANKNKQTKNEYDFSLAVITAKIVRFDHESRIRV